MKQRDVKRWFNDMGQGYVCVVTEPMGLNAWRFTQLEGPRYANGAFWSPEAKDFYRRYMRRRYGL